MDYNHNAIGFDLILDQHYSEFNKLICFVNRKSIDLLNAQIKHINHTNNVLAIVFNEDVCAQVIQSKPIFISIKLREHHLTEDNNNRIKLLVSEQFMSNYNFSLNDNNMYLSCVMQTIPLTKLIIGVKTDQQLYDEINCDIWWQNNILSSKVLCRMNDYFLGDNRLLVLNTEPVIQGLVCAKTEIIIIKLTLEQSLGNILSNCFEQNRNPNRIMKALSLLNFTSRLLIKPKPISSYDGNVTAIETFTASSTFLNTISYSFQIIILTTKIFIDDFDCENGCVFISHNAMNNKFKCFNGQWVRIWISDNNIDSTKPKQRYCQLYAIDSINEDNIAYISPQLWFNLQQFSSSQLTIKPLIQPNTTLMIKKDESICNQISYVTAIHVSLVRCPNYSATDDYSIILTNYFKKARYIVKGDIIGINSKHDRLTQFESKQLLLNEWPIIYFRVTLIEGNGCVVDADNSKLYQTGTVHSLIPVTLNSYYSLKPANSNSPCVSGLSKYVNALCDLVYPYLKPNRRTIGTILIDGPSGSGKHAIVKSMCEYWNLHLLEINANEIIGDTASSTEAKIKIALSKSCVYSPCVVLISHIHLLCNRDYYSDPRILNAFNHELREMATNCEEWPIILIGTVIDDKKLTDSELSSLFLHKIFIDCPDFEERKLMIKSLINQIPISSDVNLTELINKTSGLYFGDLCVIISNALTDLYYNFTINSLENISETDIAFSGVVLTNSYIMNALNALQRLHSDAFGAPSIPEVHWTDIGGLDNVKREILDTIQLPLEYPQLLNAGFRRSGVLLYGPPGTGKTLLAKAAATQCSLNFLSVKGPELINMYVGQSEENIRNIFSRARNAAPCVIFFDELDSLAPNRGHSGDSGGVMDRVVSQLLAEMDGLNKSHNVFVIATTNRPDLLDSALLRPGRFDRLIHVAIASDSTSRIKILQALTKNFTLQSDVKLEKIENLCPYHLSGADIYSVCANALINAITRSISDIENHCSKEENCTIIVCLSDFECALTKFIQKSN